MNRRPKKFQKNPRKNVRMLSLKGIGVTPDTSENKKFKYEEEERLPIDLGPGLAKHARSPGFTEEELKGSKSLKLRKLLQRREEEIQRSVEAAAKAEILLPSDQGFLEAEGINSTWQFSQEKIKDNLDERSAKKIFHLKLEQFGPYTIDYTRNGKYLLIGGRKGHLALFDWTTFKLSSEIHVRETIRDVHFLHDQTMYAVAQKKHLYIYDNNGIELHCLRHHVEPNRLEFLPYHFLLVSVGKSGYLKYIDTSTGQSVTEKRTKLGECDAMRQNKKNAIIHLGHHNGAVTLWSPNHNEPVVRMLCHKAGVLALDVHRSGNYMATSGLDGKMKIWDLRTYKMVHSYFTVRPANTIDISDTGLISVGFGPHIQIWKDAFLTKQKAPYMVQEFPGKDIRSVRFCPYEDVLGVGHSEGFNSLIIPGSGEPNFDTFEANPFENTKQRRERVVHQLLDKLQPDMITLDQDAFGLIDRKAKTLLDGERRAMRKARFLEEEKAKKLKDKARGGNKSSKRAKRKRANIIDQKRLDAQEDLKKQLKTREKLKKEEERKQSGKAPSALDRFNL